ncbi:MAG: DUF169 domain-containing protein [Chloroflexota bacterium]
MDTKVKDKFLTLWKKYFNDAELPLTFYYSKEAGHAELTKAGEVPRCIIQALQLVRDGRSLSFNVDSIGCAGGKKHVGFTETIRPEFEYFLSYGIPDKVRGERYKKSPELAKETQKYTPDFKAPAPYLVFKRWDKLEKSDSPDVVVFFARPDVLSGLFTLTRFDQAEPDGVCAPFGSGCSSIVLYPYLEKDAPRPRAVIGLFDPSARPYVPQDTITFSVPMTRFLAMVDNMEESFLITETWQKVQKRI